MPDLLSLIALSDGSGSLKTRGLLLILMILLFLVIAVIAVIIGKKQARTRHTRELGGDGAGDLSGAEGDDWRADLRREVDQHDRA